MYLKELPFIPIVEGEGYQIGWHIKNRVFAVRQFGDIYLRTIEKIFEHVNPILKNSKVMLHSIVDYSEISEVHFAVTDLLQLDIVLETFNDPHGGWILYYSPDQNMFYNFIGAVLSQHAKGQVQFFDSFDDCMSFLHKMDETL